MLTCILGQVRNRSLCTHVHDSLIPYMRRTKEKLNFQLDEALRPSISMHICNVNGRVYKYTATHVESKMVELNLSGRLIDAV